MKQAELTTRKIYFRRVDRKAVEKALLKEVETTGWELGRVGEALDKEIGAIMSTASRRKSRMDAGKKC